MKDNKRQIQLVWGVALLIMGIAVFFRIPYVIPKVKQFEQFASIIGFIYFCFYLISALLAAGGVKKIYVYLKKQDKQDFENPK